MKYVKKALFLIPLAAILFACSESRYPDFEKTESGLYYKASEQADEGARQVQLGDIITLRMILLYEDSMLFDSEVYDFPFMKQVSAPAYDGDIMEGVVLMKEGDRYIFHTDAYNYFTELEKMPLPDFIDSGSFVTFDVTVFKAETEQEFKDRRMAELSEHQNTEKENIRAYLEEMGLQAEPTESGLYYIEQVKGTGPAVHRGSSVSVHYIGRLLTGEKFDSSLDKDPPEPFTFTLGTGQVIPGWDEGIGYMNVGGKATLIVPFSLAYGERPYPGGVIKPYSTLVFDVELVDAK